MSSDGKTFTTLLDKTQNAVTRYVEFDELPPTTCRFVRLTLTDWPHNAGDAARDPRVHGVRQGRVPVGAAGPRGPALRRLGEMRRRTTCGRPFFALCVRTVLALVAGSVVAAAEPAPLPFVSPIFGDHMVLQRGKPNAIWGWSQPGDTVRVEIGGNSATAIAGADGRWQARIEPPPVGGPYTVKITGRQTVELQDVLVGDVWICAGQSNMQFGLAQATNGAGEIKKASPGDPLLRGRPARLLHARGRPARHLEDRLAGDERPSCGGISAVAYFFARKVQESTHVPIGLVQAAVGGVPAETFASPESLRPVKDFDAGLAEVERRAQTGGPEYGNYIMHWYDEYDIGSKNGSWADPALDDSSWKTVPIPGQFEELGVADVPSLVWFRKEITLPETLPAGPGPRCFWARSRRWTPPTSTASRWAPARGSRTRASTSPVAR